MFDANVSYALWLLNGLSLFSTFLLAHGRVVYGRIAGLTASVAWCSLGVLTQEYSFFVANVMYSGLYLHSIWHQHRKSSTEQSNDEVSCAEQAVFHTE